MGIKIMPRQGGGEASGRLVVQKFAAHLAYLLNSGDRTVTLNAGDLYRKLLRTLSGGTGRRGEGNPYVERLVAVHLLGPDMSPDQAANAYFERVLDRPLYLARRAHHHKGHDVLLALCRRGVDARWKAADLGRSSTPLGEAGLRDLPPDFEDVRTRLSEVRDRHKGHISPGNPAASTRAEYGPLYLRLASTGTEVAEELSLWEAICGGPQGLRVLDPLEFDAFCSLIIKALETANAHYGALVTLRLSPLDWAEELSVNTAKKVSAFLSEVRAVAEKLGASAEAVEIWEEVWARRQVPGFASARAFWSSPLGHALRVSGTVSRPAAPEPEEEEEEEDEDAAKIDRSAIPDMLQRYVRAGILDSYDVWLLRQLSRNRTLQQLGRSPRTLFKFGRAEIPESYIDELRERVRRYRAE